MFSVLLVCLTSMAMAGLFFWGSFGLNTLMADPGGPAIVPRVVAVIIAVAATFELLRTWRLRHLSEPIAQTFKGFASEARSGLRADGSQHARVAAAMTLCLLYPLGIHLIGFYLASALLVGLIGLVCSVSWYGIVAMAVLLPALLEVLFGALLNARIPTGILFNVSIERLF